MCSISGLGLAVTVAGAGAQPTRTSWPLFATLLLLVPVVDCRQSQHLVRGKSLRSSPLTPFATGRHGRLVDSAALAALVGPP